MKETTVVLTIGILLARTFRTGNPPTEQETADAYATAQKVEAKLASLMDPAGPSQVPAP